MDSTISVNSKKNFEAWKKIAGLDKDFPILKDLQNEDEFLKGTYISDQEKIDDIKLRITNPVICVTINKGHGCTTLFKYIYTSVKKESLIRRIIPIEINLKDFWNRDFSLNIDENIKKEILTELLQNSWEKVLSKPIYYEIIGGFEAKDKEMHKESIKALFREKTLDWKEIEKLCPKFALPIDLLLRELSGKHQIKIVLFFDIPYDVGEDYLDYLIGSIKDIFQEYRQLPGLSEIYFITPENLEKMQRSYPRSIEKIDYNSDGYNFGQVAKILSLRNRPISFQAINEMKDPLLIVFDQKFAQMAWAKEKTLHEIINDIEKIMLERLDCEKKDVPFKLEPTDKQFEKWKKAHGK